MKIKPIDGNINPIIEEARYNENILSKIDGIRIGNLSSIKKDYSSVAILSLMYEKGFVNKDNIEESFTKSQELVDSYERIK